MWWRGVVALLGRVMPIDLSGILTSSFPGYHASSPGDGRPTDRATVSYSSGRRYRLGARGTGGRPLAKLFFSQQFGIHFHPADYSGEEVLRYAPEDPQERRRDHRGLPHPAASTFTKRVPVIPARDCWRRDSIISRLSNSTTTSRGDWLCWRSSTSKDAEHSRYIAKTRVRLPKIGSEGLHSKEATSATSLPNGKTQPPIQPQLSKNTGLDSKKIRGHDLP